MRFWLTDPQMSQYFQPSTLYAAIHFDNYRNKHRAMDKEKMTTDKWNTPEAKERMKKSRKKLEEKMKRAGVLDEED